MMAWLLLSTEMLALIMLLEEVAVQQFPSVEEVAMMARPDEIEKGELVAALVLVEPLLRLVQ